MDPEVVCISDDEEAGPSNAASTSQQNTTQQRNNFHSNVYENYIPPRLPLTVQATLEFKLRNRRRNPRPQRVPEVEIVEPPNDIINVPDEEEEEELLIDPIRQICRQILFSPNIFDSCPPSEFSYNLLMDMQKHLENNLRNASFETETKVWNCVIDELMIIQLAYKHLIDVCCDLTYLLRIQFTNFFFF